MLVARRVLIVAALWLAFECTISLLATCNQVAEQASQHGGPAQAQKHCSALTGPILASGWAFLYWLGHILEGYGEAVIAVFTIVLAFATGLLWKATRDLVRGAEDTAARQLRAYIGFQKFSVTVSTLNNLITDFKFVPLFENTGTTPARKVAIFGGCKIQIGPGIPVFSKGETSGESLTFIGARQIREGRMLGFPWATFEKIAGGESKFYVWYLVEYDDVFDSRHHTQICCQVMVVSDLNRGLLPGQAPKCFSFRFEGPQNTED